MNIVISSNGSSKSADLVPGTLAFQDSPDDTDRGCLPAYRVSGVSSGSFSVYLNAAFTAADALALASPRGEGGVTLGPPVCAEHALLDVTIRPQPRRAEMFWTGKRAASAL